MPAANCDWCHARLEVAIEKQTMAAGHCGHVYVEVMSFCCIECLRMYEFNTVPMHAKTQASPLH